MSDEQRERAASRCVTHHICDCMDWRLTQAERRAERAEALLVAAEALAKSDVDETVARAERAEAERDTLRALLRECHDRFVDTYGPDGRFTRKIGAAIDAARMEGEG